MKKLILLVGLFAFVGCAQEKEPSYLPVPPFYEKPDLTNCKNEFDLVIKLDKSNLNIGQIVRVTGQIGPYPGTPAHDLDLNSNGGIYPTVRGRRFYVTATIEGMNGTATSSETGLEVYTCEVLKEKVEAGELVIDTKEITLKF